MRARSLALAVAFVVADPFTAPAAHRPALGAESQGNAREQLYGALVGRWEGTLEYKDYKDASRRVTLPTVLEVVRSADSGSVTLQMTYDDGPGKTVKETDRFVIDAAGKTVTWSGGSGGAAQHFVVRSFEAPRPGQALRLVLEGDGSDDDKSATIRETFVIGLNKLQIVKETRPAEGSSQFGFRHRYDLTRAQ
jgi:hypothetical protein